MERGSESPQRDPLASGPRVPALHLLHSGLASDFFGFTMGVKGFSRVLEGFLDVRWFGA